MRSHRSRTALGPCVGALAVASFARAQSLIHSIDGQASNEQFGAALALLGDVDGDGKSELAVGVLLGASGFGCVRAYSGATGALLWQTNGPALGSRFGTALASLADWNGDGVGELAVGAWQASVPGAIGVGIVRVLSGADGTLVLERRGDAPNDHLGWSVGDAGDVDGDGLRDFVAGAIDDDDGGSSAGSVRVFAGGSGATLLTVHGTAPLQLFGSSVCGLGDLDGDGHAEFAAGAPSAPGLSAPSGFVRVHSGASGAVLWSSSGLAPRDAFGISIDALDDVDGDGARDLLVGAQQVPALGPGYVRVLDGRTGALVLHLAGDPATRSFGACVRGIGDVDYDGRGDFAVGAPERFVAGGAAGSVGVYSGASAALLFERTGSAPNQRLGSALAGGRDVDGNRSPDLLAGAPTAAAPGANTGRVLAISGNDVAPPLAHDPLEADVDALSYAAHATQTLTLHAGARHAGQRFIMLGSLHGDTPGFDVDEHHVPLNVDAYFLISLRHPRLVPLEPARGWLDANGEAVVELAIERPWRRPALIGATFHHAYAVFDANGALAYVSNARSCTILP